jgi:hypothetical protein
MLQVGATGIVEEEEEEEEEKKTVPMTISLMLLTHSLFMNIFYGRYIDSTLHAKRYANKMKIKEKKEAMLP